MNKCVSIEEVFSLDILRKKGEILLLWIQYFLFKPQISRPRLTILNLWWELGGILLSLERIIYRGELKVTD